MAQRGAWRNFNDLTPFLMSGVAGDHIYRRGDRSRHLYIIRVGEIEVTWRGAAAQPPERLTTGDVFGELGFLDNALRDERAQAVSDYQLLRIDRQAFEQIVTEDPSIAVGMLRKLSRRLRRTQHVSSDAIFVELGSGMEFPIARETVSTIGRRAKAGTRPDIDLSAVDVERSLSRIHATVVERDGRYVLQPRATVNGTFVNGASAEADTNIGLENGDLVRFGRLELRFRNR